MTTKINNKLKTLLIIIIKKVPFQDALEFVSNMKAFLHKGFVYIHKSDLHLILIRHFKKNLMKQMIKTKNSLDLILTEDERIISILNSLPEAYLADNYVNPSKFSKNGKVNLADLEMLSKKFSYCY